MNILLDTHTFLWWIADAPPLSRTARRLIGDARNVLYWSAASSWEAAIKHGLGKLPLPAAPEVFFPAELLLNRVEPLPILDAHAFQAAQLPRHHRDPFDRMLVAQAQVETLVLLSDDSQLRLYDVKVRW